MTTATAVRAKASKQRPQVLEIEQPPLQEALRRLCESIEDICKPGTTTEKLVRAKELAQEMNNLLAPTIREDSKEVRQNPTVRPELGPLQKRFHFTMGHLMKIHDPLWIRNEKGELALNQDRIELENSLRLVDSILWTE